LIWRNLISSRTIEGFAVAMTSAKGGNKMKYLRVDKRDVAAVRDILDLAAVMYDLSDNGILYLEADYNSILDREGICYCEM